MPRPRTSDGLPSLHENLADDNGSNWASAPLAFALLPAVGGMVFKNGSAVISDILLLGLAAIFLNWSVRLPWDWYRNAQEIRVMDTYHGGTAVLDDDGISDGDDGESEAREAEGQRQNGEKTNGAQQHSARCRRLASYESSRKELYRHELLAIFCCFTFPLLGAYLLHTIRDSLSRPSEGLVSNFNLTIFILAAELKPLSHLVKLVQAHTLHLQRIVKDNPYTSVDQKQDEDIAGLRRQLASVESLVNSKTSRGNQKPMTGEKDLQAVTKEVKRQLQPELDALNRAVRRYEKRAALQAMQTESRLSELNERMDDAISLAAAALRGSGSRSVVATGLQWVTTMILLSWQVLGSVLQMPFNTIRGGLRGIGPGRRTTPPPQPPTEQGRRKSAMKPGTERDRSVRRQL